MQRTDTQRGHYPYLHVHATAHEATKKSADWPLTQSVNDGLQSILGSFYDSRAVTSHESSVY